jgi:hypothetical protein
MDIAQRAARLPALHAVAAAAIVATADTAAMGLIHPRPILRLILRLGAAAGGAAADPVAAQDRDGRALVRP